jgi:hypothetical protein
VEWSGADHDPAATGNNSAGLQIRRLQEEPRWRGRPIN